MMMLKVGTGYSLCNLLNGNLAIGLTDKMQNSDAEYYLQASALKSGVCDSTGMDRACSDMMNLKKAQIGSRIIDFI